METLSVILMLGLFIFLLVFIFSTALLTPLIGKKNILFVIMLGFTVGAVGGAFFIAPVFDDIPVIASSIITDTSKGTDVINANVSTNINITNFIQTTKQINGVQSVQSNGITLKTDPMSSAAQNDFITRIPEQNTNITSVEMPTNDTMVIQIKNNTDPQDVITNLQTWMLYVSGINVKYSMVNVSMDVQSSKIDQVKSELPQGEIVITSINGPSVNNVESITSLMPNKSNIIIFCGFLGMITGLAGMFIDSINGVFQRIRKKLSEFKR